VFNKEETKRFLGGFEPAVISAAPKDPLAWKKILQAVDWELLYRLEPQLYERLVAGERLHPAIFEWLPARFVNAVEVGAGAGRLTLELAPRCERLVAVEPAGSMRSLLEKKLAANNLDTVTVMDGFFDSLSIDDDAADLVIVCSSFEPDSAHGGESGLAELERVAAPGGLVAIVWPKEPSWLESRGYEYVSFPGAMAMEFDSLDEALEIAQIFYPDALDKIRTLGTGRIPYEVLGHNPPRDLSYKRIDTPK